jgi:hypothetical protein
MMCSMSPHPKAVSVYFIMLLLVLGTAASLSLPPAFTGLQGRLKQGLGRQRVAFASVGNAWQRGWRRHDAAIQKGVEQQNPVAIAVAGTQEMISEGGQRHNDAINDLTAKVNIKVANVEVEAGAKIESAKAQVDMGANVVGHVVKTVAKVNEASQQGAPIQALSMDIQALENVLALSSFDKKLQNEIRSQRYKEFQERFRQIKGTAAGRVVTMDKWSRLRLTISVRIESIKESLKLAIKIPQIVINMIQGLDQASKKTNPSKNLLAVIAQSKVVLAQLQDSSDISKETLDKINRQILLMENDFLRATRSNHALRRR